MRSFTLTVLVSAAVSAAVLVSFAEGKPDREPGGLNRDPKGSTRNLPQENPPTLSVSDFAIPIPTGKRLIIIGKGLSTGEIDVGAYKTVARDTRFYDHNCSFNGINIAYEGPKNTCAEDSVVHIGTFYKEEAKAPRMPWYACNVVATLSEGNTYQLLYTFNYEDRGQKVSKKVAELLIMVR